MASVAAPSALLAGEKIKEKQLSNISAETEEQGDERRKFLQSLLSHR